MALSISCLTERRLSLEEYLDHVEREVDVRDRDSIAASATLLAALANDAQLVVRRLNELVKNQYRGTAVGSAQVIFLGRGRHFYVRANVWPSAADVKSGRIYQDNFAYDVAHDHDFDFMTVTHFGPGYRTEIHEYDRDGVLGRAGEPVALRFLERTELIRGKAMLYRANRDVHIQFPPEDLSITLNLMIEAPEAFAREQYFFDLERGCISGCASEQGGISRLSAIALAGYAGDDETRQVLGDLAKRHPCRRTRLKSFEALARLSPERETAIWETACEDAERLVSEVARERLRMLKA